MRLMLLLERKKFPIHQRQPFMAKKFMFQLKSKFKKRKLVIRKSLEKLQLQKQLKLNTKEQHKSVLLRDQLSLLSHQSLLKKFSHVVFLKMNKLALKLNLTVNLLPKSSGSEKTLRFTTLKISKFTLLELNQS